MPPRRPFRRADAPRQRELRAHVAVAVIALVVAACASVPSRTPTDRSAVGTFSTPVTDLQFIDVDVGVGADIELLDVRLTRGGGEK